MVQSPLNYTGGKYKLLPQILPLFPKHLHVFVDLFCGGCNVGCNVESRQVIFNDCNSNLLSIYQTLKSLKKECTFQWIYEIIDHYNLSLVSRHGYEYYHCESSKGLSQYNKDKFLKLREDFNKMGAADRQDSYYYIMLFVMIVYSFNNQIRFNNHGEFNLPVGKRDFNKRIEQKLSDFIDRIQHKDCTFTCKDFRDFDISTLTPSDFVYADPPYLITCATYNEQGGWSEDAERDLLAFLDRLHQRHIPFALSNVLRSKGKENQLLADWLEKNTGIYRAVPLSYSYANSNYQTKDKSSVSEEVLILNY